MRRSTSSWCTQVVSASLSWWCKLIVCLHLCTKVVVVCKVGNVLQYDQNDLALSESILC